MPRRFKASHLLLIRWTLLLVFASVCSRIPLGQVFDFGCYWNPNGGPLVQSFPRASVPTDIDLGDVVALAAGAAQSIALHANGTISVWGDFRMGEATASPPIDDAVAIGAGFFHGLAIRQDGTIWVWGENDYQQLDAPEGLTNVIAVTGSFSHSMALKADGTVVLWGQNFGQISPPPGLSNVVSITTGQSRALAVKADGTVISMGSTFNSGYFALPSGLTNIIQAAAGDGHLLFLKSDGTVIGLGDDSLGQATPPADLTNVVAISAGSTHSIALKKDGSLVIWGSGTTYNPNSGTGADWGQAIIPDDFNSACAISAGMAHSLALSSEMPPYIFDRPAPRVVAAGTSTWLRGLASGFGPLSYQWKFNGENIEGATNNVLELAHITLEQAGKYTVIVTNALGKATNDTTVAVQPFFLPTLPFSQSTIAGGSVSFIVEASGTGPFTYQWKFNGQDIVGATSATLLLTNIQSTQVGTYSVTVSNSFGSLSPPDVTLSLTQIAAWGNNRYGQTNVPPGLSNIVALAAGANHALALDSVGAVSAWGFNLFSQTNVPTDATNVIRIASGANHSIALKADGNVMAWGNSNGGQCNVPESVSNVVDVAGGAFFSLALKANGTIALWGLAPSTNSWAVSNIVAIAASDRIAAALKSDGNVVTWGVIPNESSGSGHIIFPPPPPPPPLTNIVAIAVGSNHVVALRADGRVETRGSDNYLQVTVPSGLSNVIAVAAGAAHSMALLKDGSVVAWGGSNGTVIRPFFFPGTSNSLVNFGQGRVPSFLPKVSQIAAGGLNSYALVGEGPPHVITPIVDRTVLAGSNAFFRVLATGALPINYQWKCNGTNIPNATNSFLALTNVNFSSAGAYTVAINNDLSTIETEPSNLQIAPLFVTTMPANRSTFRGGSVSLTTAATGKKPFRYQWRFQGSNIPNATNGVLTLNNLRLDQAGDYDVVISNDYGPAVSDVARVSVGLVAAWGNNTDGQINLPPDLLQPARIVAARHNLLLNRDGTVVSWGWNVLGQTNVPTGLSEIVQLAAGGNFSLALDTNGAVTLWGYNDPPQIDMFAGWMPFISIAAGPGHSLGLTSDGHVVAAGADYDGQTDVPPDLQDVVGISAGGSQSAALRSDGSLVTWGYPTAPEGLSNIVAVSCGYLHALALRSDGTVLAWGRNDEGETNVPPGLTGVVAIAAGDFHCVALKDDGSIVAWGNNSSGQTNVPPGITNAIAIAAGSSHTVAILADGPPSSFATLTSPSIDAQTFTAFSTTTNGRAYRLEVSDGLEQPVWVPFPLSPGNGARHPFTDAVNGRPQRFYRLRQW